MEIIANGKTTSWTGKTKPNHAVNNTYQRWIMEVLIFALTPGATSSDNERTQWPSAEIRITLPTSEASNEDGRILLTHVRYCTSQTNYLHVQDKKEKKTLKKTKLNIVAIDGKILILFLWEVWWRNQLLLFTTVNPGCSLFLALSTKTYFAFQIFPSSNNSSPSVWLGERIWADRPPVSHISRCQQLHQNGGWNRRLPTHRIWIQQIQVRATLLSSNPQIYGSLKWFLYLALLLLGTTSKMWLLGRSTSCWSGSRSNIWNYSLSRKR